jgi:hypothetical protein
VKFEVERKGRNEEMRGCCKQNKQNRIYFQLFTAFDADCSSGRK